MIVADDLRADVMSVYDGPVQTPNLQKLATRGVMFRRAVCGYPICHVSRSEILTGRSLVAEAASGGSIPLKESWTLLPQVMQQVGWQTVHLGKWQCQRHPAQCGYSQTAAI